MPVNHDGVHASARLIIGARERAYVAQVVGRFIRSHDDAEDVTQDALLLAHCKLHQFQGKSRFTTWLYRVAVTTSLMYLRMFKRRGEIRGSMEESGAADSLVSPDDPESLVGELEEREYFLAAFASLRGSDQLLLRRYFNEHPMEEVARDLGTSAKAVKSATFRARATLRVALSALR